MKKLISLCAFLIFACILDLHSQEILNNQSVIDMVQIGFEEQVIIDKIKSSETNFVTTIDALKMLKEKGVPKNVLSIMMKSPKQEAVIKINESSTISDLAIVAPKNNIEKLYFKFGSNNGKFLFNFFDQVMDENGKSYELGFVLPSEKLGNKISVSAAITLDEYSDHPIYLTPPSGFEFFESNGLKFLGFQGLAKYNVFDLNEIGNIPVKMNILGGLNLNHQIASDLNNATEFDKQLYRGLFIKPILGFGLQFQVNDYINLESEYRFSYSYGLWNGISYNRGVSYFNFFDNDQDLNILNHQINFGLVVSFN